MVPRPMIEQMYGIGAAAYRGAILGRDRWIYRRPKWFPPMLV